MLCRLKALLLSTWPGVLFLVQFNNFDWTKGFYWSLHALTLAACSYVLLGNMIAGSCCCEGWWLSSGRTSVVRSPSTQAGVVDAIPNDWNLFVLLYFTLFDLAPEWTSPTCWVQYPMPSEWKYLCTRLCPVTPSQLCSDLSTCWRVWVTPHS